MNLKKTLISISALALLVICGVAVAQNAAESGEGGLTFSWKKIPMDGSRAGIGIVTTDNADSLDQIFGVFKGNVYVAPNGKKYSKGCTPAVAKLLIEAQPALAELRTPLGYAPESMIRVKPECGLYNMYVDRLMASVEQSCGQKIDAGFTNTGGVRCDMTKGKQALGDVLSMFPFKSNKTAFVQLAGKDLRVIYQQMAANPGTMIQGGAKLVYTADHKLKSVTMNDGQPLNDKKIYNVATINFVLNGGDGFNIAKNAKSIEMYDVTMSEFMADYYKQLTAEGKEITYPVDGRITQE